MKYCWISPIIRKAELGRENACVLRLVLFEDIGLHRAPYHVERVLAFDSSCIGFRIQQAPVYQFFAVGAQQA